MAAYLKKMLERTSDPPDLRVELRSDWFNKRTCTVDTPLGAFERIPQDVVLLILKLLGLEGAMTMILVSKSWKPLVTDHRLWMFFLQNSWNSVIFSETHLRLGFPLQRSLVPRQTFMEIYGQRKQVPASIILDAGSGYCKLGWSNNDYPSVRSYSFSEFEDLECPQRIHLRNYFFTFYRRMQACPESQPIVLTIPLWQYWSSPIAARKRNKKTILSELFEMKVPAVCALNQETLALYAARQTSGIAVNIGFMWTTVVPVRNGEIMEEFVEILPIGSLKLGSIWEKMLEQKGIHHLSDKAALTLKERLCYVAADYDAELQKDTKASYTVGAEGRFTLSKERFQLGEMLFKTGSHSSKSLDEVVAKCMKRCHGKKLINVETNDDSSNWFKTIVLCGGTASLPGLAFRLEKELHRLLSPSIANGIKIIPPPYGTDTAWVGAKLISNVSEAAIYGCRSIASLFLPPIVPHCCNIDTCN